MIFTKALILAFVVFVTSAREHGGEHNCCSITDENKHYNEEEFKELRDAVKAAVTKDLRLVSKSGLYCTACITAFDTIILKRRVLKFNDKLMRGMFDMLCKTIFRLVYDPVVCLGLVESNLVNVLFLIDNKPEVKGSNVCTILLQNFDCKGELPAAWSINIPQGHTVPKKSSASGNPIHILQITDIHYDPKYMHNSKTNCNKPLCCQNDDGRAIHLNDAAGYWTDYRNCDTSAHMISHAFEFAKKHMIFDYIYVTGDVIGHRIWDTSIESNTNDFAFVMDEFRRHFGNKTVFPILGNHDPHPLNLYAPDSLNTTSFSTQWLYNLAANEWKLWLPEDALTTVRRGGFYTVLVKPGFRVIALNSNVAYTLNYWLIFDDKDTYGQLQWLADVLHKAEQDGETVHILTHVPTGDADTYTPWATQFRNIIERFSNTITGIFNGHTHFAEMNVYYSQGHPDKAVAVGYNGGSLTPYTNVNPNMRVYSVDSINFEVVDFDEWIFNVTKANIGRNFPHWYKLYSFKQEYGLQSASREAIAKLANTLTRNATLRHKYQKNKVRIGDPSLADGCNDHCHQNNICNFVTTVYTDKKHCNSLLKDFH